ncbi:MAG: PEP-CTERM sorting domain-containing protein [Verrucomicrobia bacterium]|nr:PEP-CTERM sorting domain-containing protein [Verrucomicrobiota bacterium]
MNSFYCRPALIAVILLGGSDFLLAQGITTTRIASGLNNPIYATAPPNDPSRLFIVERGINDGTTRTGNIKILDLNTNTVLPTPFLTIPDLSPFGQSEGLFSIAFHPNYEQNGFFYVSAMDENRDTTIRRYQVSSSNPNVADPNYVPILEYPQRPSHNNSWIGFSPDGYLYINNGDGGGGPFDPDNNAQNINNLYGSVLRLDVGADGLADDFPADSQRNYAIPPSNPFVNQAGLDEIWSYGLRSPWRASFDRETGDFYLGDVGQNTLDELNFQKADSAGGENYGWRLREGTIPTPPSFVSVGGSKPPGNVDPIYDYPQGFGSEQGFSITAGYVYRGPIAELQGKYFFADFVNPRVWSLEVDVDGLTPDQYDGTNFTEFTDWTDQFAPDEGSLEAIVSFAEDSVGNLYIVTFGDVAGGESSEGAIFKIIPIIPEPSSLLLFATGTIALLSRASRRRQKVTI